ncbi:MAG: hypothetical protein KatS3mg059_0601 [Thermomicrobiales bacterium]|nr:MAG: hypothetical protein KatS3mg059_0601 [Thermomicrobiales bacterium]
MANVSWRALHLASRLIVQRRITLEVSGRDLVPATGPVIVAARHFHHLYDGCILLATINRPAHILAAIDWMQHPIGRAILRSACRAAQWPVIHRPDSPYPGRSADARHLLLQATRQTLRLLEHGHVVMVFPEAYPTIDPGLTLKTRPDEFLAFRPGFARFALLASRIGLRVPIVPAGLAYERAQGGWHVVLRFGEPVIIGPGDQAVAEVVRLVEDQVKTLSLPGAERAPALMAVPDLAQTDHA